IASTREHNYANAWGSNPPRVFANSGERTRLACWFRRRDETILCLISVVVDDERTLRKVRDREDALASTRDARAIRSFRKRTSTIPDRALPSPAQLYDRPLHARGALRTLPSQNQTLAPRPLPVA